MLDSTRSGVENTNEIGIYLKLAQEKFVLNKALCTRVLVLCMWQETPIMALQQFLPSAWLATVIIIFMMITVITYLIHFLTRLPYFPVVFVIPPYGFMALCLIYTRVTSRFNLIAL